MKGRLPLIADLLFQALTSEVEPLPVEERAASFDIGHPEQHWGSVDHFTETPLAFGNCDRLNVALLCLICLGRLALAQVIHERHTAEASDDVLDERLLI